MLELLNAGGLLPSCPNFRKHFRYSSTISMIFANKTPTWTQIRFYHYALTMILKHGTEKPTQSTMHWNFTFEAASTCLQLEDARWTACCDVIPTLESVHDDVSLGRIPCHVISRSALAMEGTPCIPTVSPALSCESNIETCSVWRMMCKSDGQQRLRFVESPSSQSLVSNTSLLHNWCTLRFIFPPRNPGLPKAV